MSDGITNHLRDDIRNLIRVLVYLLSRLNLSPTETMALFSAQCAEQLNDWPQPTDRNVSPDKILHSIRALSKHASTIGVNLVKEPEEQGMFERFCTVERISPNFFAEFQDFVNNHGQAFLEETDVLLSDDEYKDEDEGISFGVGVYLFSDHQDFRNSQLLLNPVSADAPNVSMVDLFLGRRASEGAECPPVGSPLQDEGQRRKHRQSADQDSADGRG